MGVKGLLKVDGGVTAPDPPGVLEGLVPLEGIEGSPIGGTENLGTLCRVSPAAEPWECDVGRVEN